MGRLTEKDFKFTSDYVASKLQSWSIAQCLNKLQKYENLEEQGLLLRLPCKVGTGVWYISPHNSIALEKGKIYKAVVTRVCVKEIGTSVAIRVRSDYGVTEIPSITDFGKAVFLTKEDAEEALQKMREQGDE